MSPLVARCETSRWPDESPRIARDVANRMSSPGRRIESWASPPVVRQWSHVWLEPMVRLALRVRASFIRNDSPDVTTTIA